MIPRELRGIIVAFGLVTTATYALTHVGQARFRGEVEFVLVPLAAAGLAAALRRLRGGAPP
jgi:hypothetical protein